MTPSSATGLDEKALEAANAAFSEAHNVPQQCYDCAGTGRHSDESTCRTCEGNGWVAPKGWDPMASAIRAYMSALTVTSFPPAEQHDVTSHAVPLADGEGAVAWQLRHRSHRGTDASWCTYDTLPAFHDEADAAGPWWDVRPLFTHPAPVAAQPAERLREALRGVVLLHELYLASDRSPQDAYYILAKQEATWDKADAALLASSPPPTAPVVPAAEGWVLVPREPTEAMVEAGIDALREHSELLAIARDPLFVWRYMLSALPAQPNSSERQKALDAAADLIDGWTTATNSRHLQGWGVHTNAVADMLAKRDAEMADAVRALLPTPPEAKTP